jgi:hypothetical protein
MMKPMVRPPTLVLTIVHGMCASGLPMPPGAARSSSSDTSRTPIRLVNHVESGTSSCALTPRARRCRGSSRPRVMRR